MSDRRMIYPYTLTSKLVNFPYKYYFKNNIYYRHYLYAIVATFPFFLYVQNLSYSEANLIKLEEFRKKEEEEFQHHKEHRL